MESRLKPRIVHVNVDEKAEGLFIATSAEIKGLLVAEATLAEALSAVPGAISDLYAVCGETVAVIPMESDGGPVSSWLEMPAEIAETAINAARSRQSEV